MGNRVCKVVLLALLSVGLPLGASAQDASPPAPPPTADLPVTKVVLFTTGVGYFEHGGTVTGTERLVLPVAADQMDDLLQSLVVEDTGGGTVRPVRYPSQDPLGRILAGYTLDLSHDPGLAGLLSQARGQRVHLEAGRSLDGIIVNVEQLPTNSGPPSTMLTLLTGAGLQRIGLDEVRSVRFDDPAVQADLEAALAAIARTRRNDAGSVQLLFAGEGTRHVRFGYVREMPVWKTSYRLVLGGDGTADLQGWAIVDNPTDLDLSNVQMTFVAGQPISFVAGLYDPIYRQRPHVALDLAQGIVPRAYGGDSAPAVKSADRAAAPAPNAVAGLAQAASAPQLRGAGVEALARGVGTGATFQYRVSQPVSVSRHQSAMIPIVLATVHAQPLSVVDTTVLADHPLRGVRLVNDTGLHLASGPVTVYDAGGFTGDTRITDIVPGDARILTYAVDLGVDVAAAGSSAPERVTAVTLADGMLVATAKQRLTTTYTLAARDGEARFLVVEHPKRAGYALVAPTRAAAETAHSYRLGVALTGSDGTAPAADATDATVPTVLRCRAGEPCSLEVVLERTVKRTIAISNLATGDIASYLENVDLSAADRATLSQVLDLKRQLADLDRRIADRTSRVDVIVRDQDRIRRNMAALDRTSALYRRYIAGLESQESELQTLRSAIADLQTQRTTLQGRLDALLRSLGSGS